MDSFATLGNTIFGLRQSKKTMSNYGVTMYIITLAPKVLGQA